MRAMQNKKASGALVLALSTLATVAVVAPVSAASVHGASAPANGLQAAIDPSTGKLRQPTPAESRALVRQAQAATGLMNKAAGNVQVTTFADGTMSAVLTPDFLNVWIAGLNADGSLSQACVDAPNAAVAQPTPGFEEK